MADHGNDIAPLEEHSIAAPASVTGEVWRPLEQGYLSARSVPPHELYSWLCNELQKETMMAHKPHRHIVIYTTPTCPDCLALKTWLRIEGVVFEERDLTDPKIAAEAKARTGVRVAPITLVGETVFYGTFLAQKPSLAIALGLSHGV